MLMISVSLLASGQNVFMDINHSTQKLTGLNIYKTTESGLIYGIGGSYLFGTYKGETRGRYEELLNFSLGNDGDVWGDWFNRNFNVTSFTEYRGTVKALIGHTIKTTSIYASTGLAFRSKYWKGTNYDGMPGFGSPEGNFYVFKNIAPKVLYGININHTLAGRIGLNVGYNNIEKLTYGITYRITPTEWFNY